MKAMTRAKNK